MLISANKMSPSNILENYVYIHLYSFWSRAIISLFFFNNIFVNALMLILINKMPLYLWSKVIILFN